MATLHREISLDAPAETVWPAIRDFGQVHARVAPGFLTALEMDKGDRVVTFFNGLVARERLVTADDEDRRLVYAVVEGGPATTTPRSRSFPRARPGADWCGRSISCRTNSRRRSAE